MFHNVMIGLWDIFVDPLTPQIGLRVAKMCCSDPHFSKTTIEGKSLNQFVAESWAANVFLYRIHSPIPEQRQSQHAYQ